MGTPMTSCGPQPGGGFPCCPNLNRGRAATHATVGAPLFGGSPRSHTCKDNQLLRSPPEATAAQHGPGTIYLSDAWPLRRHLRRCAWKSRQMAPCPWSVTRIAARRACVSPRTTESRQAPHKERPAQMTSRAPSGSCPVADLNLRSQRLVASKSLHEMWREPRGPPAVPAATVVPSAWPSVETALQGMRVSTLIVPPVLEVRIPASTFRRITSPQRKPRRIAGQKTLIFKLPRARASIAVRPYRHTAISLGAALIGRFCLLHGAIARPQEPASNAKRTIDDKQPP